MTTVTIEDEVAAPVEVDIGTIKKSVATTKTAVVIRMKNITSTAATAR